MFAVTFIIVAFSAKATADIELFRWTRDAASGIRRAESDAARMWQSGDLSNFRAIPVSE